MGKVKTSAFDQFGYAVRARLAGQCESTAGEPRALGKSECPPLD
ncbi:hypothetical protein [Burkholderia cepacia]|nr:hypothetical protein [Burkholderia cepacia]MDN7616603.1 hypothetical protein [Burkholderia cepacia]